ncbi:MAG: response regulator [Erythrobacter sp.]
MSNCVLLLEDEPLILLDLEYAVEDRGYCVLPTQSCTEALAAIEGNAQRLVVAVLDVSLGGEGNTCFPVAQELDRRGIPYILHSGDLDRHDEKIRRLDAELVAKPAPAEKVITAAIAYALDDGVPDTVNAPA